jgi:hypothetical protein
MTILGIGVLLSYLVDIGNTHQRALFGEGLDHGESKNPQICIG